MNRNMPIDTELLREIQATQFALIEMTLFLNTHPSNRRALNRHNELARKLMTLQDRYAEEYGPLMPHSPMFDYPWNWIEEPWPWQIEY